VAAHCLRSLTVRYGMRLVGGLIIVGVATALSGGTSVAPSVAAAILGFTRPGVCHKIKN
jgi:hypothetical protein